MKHIAFLLTLGALIALPVSAYALVDSFSDTFVGVNGTTLQAHNPAWVNVVGNGVNDGVIQSNKATPEGTGYMSYSLNGFSSQAGDQCITYTFTLDQSNLGVGAALYGSVSNNKLVGGYLATVRRVSENTLSWGLVSADYAIAEQGTPTQTFDLDQPHVFAFCDTGGTLSLKVDATVLTTVADQNIYSSGAPITFVDVGNTISNFSYETE